MHCAIWYAHRALPWGLRNRSVVATFCLLSFVLSMLLVPLGVVGEEFIPSTDRGQIFVQLTYPIGTPLTTVRDGAYALEKQIERKKDVSAEATTAGGYSASFGGYVIQGNVAQITVFLQDARRHSTTYWVSAFKKFAAQTVRQATAVVVPSTGTTGGNKQPIDFSSAISRAEIQRLPRSKYSRFSKRSRARRTSIAPGPSSHRR